MLLTNNNDFILTIDGVKFSLKLTFKVLERIYNIINDSDLHSMFGLKAESPFDLTLKETPTYGMCTDASRFYTFVKGEFIEFYPKRNSVIKWLQVTEEMHRMHGGNRKNYKD